MSNAETIQIEYQTVEQIATQFDDHADHVNRTLKQLAESLDVLSNGAWLGDNATLFYVEMENDVLPAVLRLRQALHQAGDDTRQIMQIMRDAEEEAAAIFAGGDSYARLLDNLIDRMKFLASEGQGNLITILNQRFAPAIAHKFMNLIKASDSMSSLRQMFRIQQAFTALTFGIGGVVSGLLDYAGGVATGQHGADDMQELSVQVTSGVAQSAIMLGTLMFVPGGQAIVVGYAVYQVSMLVAEMGFDGLANLTGIEGFRDVGDAINSFRETVSLDNVVDSTARWIAESADDVLDGVSNFFGF